jgi:hypothetical protein
METEQRMELLLARMNVSMKEHIQEMMARMDESTKEMNAKMDGNQAEI